MIDKVPGFGWIKLLILFNLRLYFTLTHDAYNALPKLNDNIQGIFEDFI